MTDSNSTSMLGWMGCAISVFGLILLIFILTHIGPIWAMLSRAVGS
jgi:isoprenylcysteine carboxyl methyltransferase (ICMT) family protein YpbQ